MAGLWCVTGALCALPLVAVMHIAWYSEDKPFAIGYADGKLLIGSKEPLEKGAIVVIDAHKVRASLRAEGGRAAHPNPTFSLFIRFCSVSFVTRLV